MLIKKENENLLLFTKHLSTCIHTYCKTFSNKELILSNTSIKETIGFITRGKATILKTDIYGNTTIMRELKVNDIFSNVFHKDSEDEIYIISNKETEVIFIDYYAILKNCHKNCSFHNNIITFLFKLLINDDKEQNEKIELLSRRTVREKFLFFLRKRLNQDHIFRVTTSYKAIAEYICVDRSNLMREIKKLEKEGILKKEKDTIYYLK